MDLQETPNSQKEKKQKPIILYIDDEKHNLVSFKATFRRDFNVLIAESAEEGKKLVEEKKPHVIITDQRMPKTTGVEFLSEIKETYPDPIRMLLTGYSDLETVINAVNQGKIYHYISKPWEENYLRNIISKAVEVFNLKQENKLLTESLIQANKQLEFMLRQNLLS